MTPDALEALERAGFSRRNFLKGAGALIVSFSMAGVAQKLVPNAALAAPLDVPLNQVDSWVAIAQDGSITAYTGKCEFGQGFRTVQYQLVADELYVPIERVTLIVCDTDITPNQGVTSGSQSHPTEFGPNGLRQALATAREWLFQKASTQLNVPVDQLTVNDGVISMKTDPTKSVTYGQLVAGGKFNAMVSPTAKPKDPKDYTVLGTSVPRYEIPGIVTGQYQLVHHVRLPGMVHGKVVRPPTVGATFVSINNQSEVESLPGNPKVIVKGNFVGVVADKQWQAIKAVEALKVTWAPGPALPKQSELYDYMRKQPSQDSYTVNTGDVDQMYDQALIKYKQTYLHPYQMHGSVGSSCAVADVQGTGSTAKATIYSPTQGVYPQRDSVAKVLGIPNTNVRVIFVQGSGCYGLNGADTVSYDAAILSQAVGKPVRVQLTRKEEMAWENYGPAYVIDLRAGLDDKGNIITWDYEGWSLAKGNRPSDTAPGNIVTGALVGQSTQVPTPRAAQNPTTFSNNSNTASSYGAGVVGGTARGTGSIRSERVLSHSILSPFFTGPLRSPARLQNTFANESFMDELAVLAKADPVEFRLRHLTDPRLIDVVKGAANAANWEPRPSPKPGNSRTGVVTGRGIACVLYEGNNGYCATVAEVEVDQDTGKVVVKRFVVSHDCGPISNPDGLRNQMEGGTLQGMSRALKEEVKWDDQKITSIDWITYPVIKFGEPVPVIDTVLIPRLDKPQMGAGENAITAVAAAIANAIFDATSARIRQVPFTPARVKAALDARS
jgi:CO/xanthine dehydrogenase Mo-binding subunit